MDLLAYNNERFQFSQNLSAYASLYDLSSAAFRMQVRRAAKDTQAAVTFATGDDGAPMVYDPGSKIVVALCAQERVADLSGKFAWDYGFTPAGGAFVRIDGGTITFEQGVTR